MCTGGIQKVFSNVFLVMFICDLSPCLLSGLVMTMVAKYCEAQLLNAHLKWSPELGQSSGNNGENYLTRAKRTSKY